MNHTENIVKQIKFGGMTNSELTEINRAVLYARAQLVKKATSSLVVGQSVKFNNGTSVVNGSVVAVKRKFIHVKEGFRTWRVYASLVEAT